MTASTNADRPPSAAAPSRREMLNYAFGASIALMLAGSCGGLVWFLQKQISFEEGSGYYRIELWTLPKIGEPPVGVEGIRYWLVHFDTGLIVYSAVCSFRGCLVRWSAYNGRFECPCCGSKFHLDGTYIEGPATRGLDRLVLTITTDHGTFTTPRDGSPVAIDGAKSIILNANDNQLILGKPRPPRLT